MRVYFSELQADAIIDRLDEYDSIAEALGITGVEQWSSFTCMVDLLASSLKTDLSISATLGDMEKAILADCIEGSTWATRCMNGSQHTPESRGAYKVLVNAAKKLKELGVEINTIPA